MTSQIPILTVTLNPALDVTTSVPRLEPFAKLRCATPHYDPGGGGVNVSRVVHELGGDSLALVAVGGSTGTRLADLLDERGVRARYLPVDGETRTSFTVADQSSKANYRFVLPGADQSADRAIALLDAVRGSLEAAPGFVVLSGSLLPGLPKDFYAQLTAAARAHGGTVILDAHGSDLALALPARPHILRLNHIEAAALLGEPPLVSSAPDLCRRLLARDVADTVLVSLAEQGTAVASAAGVLLIRPPRVMVRSSVGAGDSLVGALVLGLARGWPLADAARFGVAAAAAAVTTEGAHLCERQTTERLLLQTVAEAVEAATV